MREVRGQSEVSSRTCTSCVALILYMNLSTRSIIGVCVIAPGRKPISGIYNFYSCFEKTLRDEILNNRTRDDRDGYAIIGFRFYRA